MAQPHTDLFAIKHFQSASTQWPGDSACATKKEEALQLFNFDSKFQNSHNHAWKCITDALRIDDFRSLTNKLHFVKSFL